MSEVVMRLVALTGSTHPGSVPGRPGDFLAGWDLEFAEGRGVAWWTPNLDEAHRFPNQLEALMAYRGIPRSRPIRQDGKPNRPLTAYTVEVVPLATLRKNP